MASNRTLTVTIVGDERDLSRSFKRGGQEAKAFGKTIGEVKARTAVAAGGLTLLATKVVQFGTASAQAAIDAEASQAKVKRMVENAGLSWEEYGGQIDKVIQAQSRLTGFDDEELAESFANMLRTTKDVNEAFRLNGLAADIARTKGTDLAGAQSLLARVYNGSFMGLKRLGIAFKPVTAAQDELRQKTKHATEEQKRAAKAADAIATRQAAIAAVTKSFSGQAKAYGETTAGAVAKAGVAWENLQEEVGARVAPAFAHATTAILNNGDAIGNVARYVGVAAAAYAGYRTAIAGATAAEGAFSAVQAARARLSGGLQGITLASTAATFGQAKAVSTTASSFKAFVPTLAETVGKQQAMRAAFVAWGPAATAAAGQTSVLSKAFSALGGAIKATPIGLVAGAVTALAAGYFLLRDRTSATEERTKAVNAAFAGTARASRAAAAALRDQAAATDRLKGANLDVSQAKLNLEEARTREKATRGTKDHAQALIDMKRAQLQVRDATRAQTDATKGAVDSSKAATRQADTQAAKAATALKIIRDNVLAKGTDATYTSRVARAENDLAQKLQASATAHLRAASNARAQAKALDTTTASGKKAKAILDKIAQTNVGLAGLSALAAAADGARRNVDALLRRLQAAQSKGGGGGGGSGTGKGEKSIERGGLAGMLGTRLGPRGSAAAQAQDTLTGIGRSSPLAEDQARARGEANFKAAVGAPPKGKEVNPDAVRMMGEKAVLAERKKTNTREQGIVARALRKTRNGIKAKRSAISANNKALTALKKPGPKAKQSAKDAYEKSRQKLITRGQNLRDDLEGLYGDESNLMAVGADLIAEAAEIDNDSSTLDGEIASTPALVDSVDDSGGSSSAGGGGTDGVPSDGAAQGLRADVARAELTPDTADDITSINALLANRNAALNEAIAAGNSDAIISIVSEIKSLNASIEELTGATNANTTATEAVTETFAGTVAFSAHGQSYVVGQSSDSINNIALGV